MCFEMKFDSVRAITITLDCTGSTGKLEGCTVVWTSHRDTETPFQLREKERKSSTRGNAHGEKVMQIQCTAKPIKQTLINSYENAFTCEFEFTSTIPALKMSFHAHT